MPDASAVSRRLPRTRAVDRIAFLERLARGKIVVHVGFAGEGRARLDELIGRPTWLHGRLAGVATRLVGVDLDAEAVDRARVAGFEAHRADAADPRALAKLGLPRADLVIAGEVIEHLEAPGPFLDGMHGLLVPGGQVAVTTPNAASILNPLAAMGRRELINPDHVCFYSWYTLTNILERHGWDVGDFVTYHFPIASEAWTGSGPAAVGRVLVRVQTAAARWWPFLDFGLIAVATSSTSPAGTG